MIRSMRPLSLAILAMVVIVLAGCGGGSSGSAVTVTETETVTVAAETAEAQAATESAETANEPSEPASDYMFVGGTPPNLANGDGEIAVVAIGRYDTDTQTLPYVLRNNTDTVIASVHMSGTAYDTNDQLVATGQDQGINPDAIPPGGLAVGYVYFGADLPDQKSYELETSGIPLAEVEFGGRADLTITDARIADGRIVGFGTNMTEATVTGPISFAAVCFDGTSAITRYVQAYGDKDQAAAGERVPFSIDLTDFGTSRPLLCDGWLLAGTGYAS